MSKGVGVSIVDRDEVSREGLRCLLVRHGLGRIAAFADVAGACAAPSGLVVVRRRSAANAVVDCMQVHLARPEVRIAAIVDDCCLEAVADLLDAGVDGVLSSVMPPDPLVMSLRLVALGEKFVPACVMGRTVPPAGCEHVPRIGEMSLSVRERAVLDRIAAGRANKLISRDLGIAEGTVKVHVKSILRKLGLANRTQAALWATERPPLLLPVSHVYRTRSTDG